MVVSSFYIEQRELSGGDITFVSNVITKLQGKLTLNDMWSGDTAIPKPPEKILTEPVSNVIQHFPVIPISRHIFFNVR